MNRSILAAILLPAFASLVHAQSSASPAVRSIALPGASAAGVSMDYIAYERSGDRVWVPAGNTGAIDIVDVANGRIDQVTGFATAEVERNGKRRTLGPSSATVGDGVVYVGDRADSSVCAIEAKSLRKTACVTLDSTPDGLAFVARTKEVWATTPRDSSITIVDAAVPGALKVKTKIRLAGAPEGFAVDLSRGVFFTNLEDKDRTLTIDVVKRTVTHDWPANCGTEGPRGLALDDADDFLFVACTDHVRAIDAGHGGAELSALDTGAGVDNIEYAAKRHGLYVGAARAAKLTVARVGSNGKLQKQFVIPTATGARNAVVSDGGDAYLTDSAEGKLLVVSVPR
jgi:hypothetical protein